jgi:DNA primase
VPDDQAKLVKERNDIVEVIGEYVNLTRNGRLYKGLCPFHDDHRPSFQVDPVRQSWVCWPCNLRGDVYAFVMKKERLEFREAMEFLARRAGIELKKINRTGPSNQDFQEILKWAVDHYHQALFQPEHRHALDYITEERQLAPEILERYDVGFAPGGWEWLSNLAAKERKSAHLLNTIRLCGLRKDGSLYDLFRDRIIFPIRDVQGRVVALGGRLLPNVPTDQNQAKYYNSADSPLFKKSQHLYGLDVARSAAERAGYLAVVEGYMDVLMAHQHGILPVVATLGTALNENHIAQLKRFVSRVVLVFDADAGGAGGVERALGLFVQSEMELAVATLPAGQDPCDFLLTQGAKPFAELLENAPDVLDFTLTSAFASARAGVEGQRQAIEKVLGVLARLPLQVRENLAVKRELVLTRLSQRSGVPEATLRRRLQELQREVNKGESKPTPSRPVVMSRAETPADKLERELIQVLLVQPKFIADAREHVQPEMMTHANRRRVLAELYELAEEGDVNVDTLRERLADDSRLVDIVSRLHAEGMDKVDPHDWYPQVKEAYMRNYREQEIAQVREQIRTWQGPGPPNDLLTQLQELEKETKMSA